MTLIKFLIYILKGNSVKLRIAIDYDGTIVKNGAFPAAGKFRRGAIKWMTWLKHRGHELILNTCRCDKYKNHNNNDAFYNAVYQLTTNAPLFFYINRNDPKLTESWGADPRKISADLYIDDKSLIPWSWWMVPIFTLYREYLKFKELNNDAANDSSPVS